MAYFHCLIGGGSSGGGYELTVTCDADFAGTTITCTDGVTTLTQTCPSSSPYEVVFAIPNGGEWTISGIISGQTYSTAIDIPDSLELHSIPEGSTVLPTDDIQTWLACAGITDKSYTTLNEVLSDSTTLLALISDNNASDYLVRSTTWASGITADSTAMTDIGADDYCAETLLDDSTWLTAICNSTYFESVLDAKVPTMTSNTTPSGEVIYTGANAGGNYKPYYAFDKNSTNAYAGANNVECTIGYHFASSVTLNKASVNLGTYSSRVPKFKIQGSNDGDSWVDVSGEIVPSGTQTEVLLNSGSTTYDYARMYMPTQGAAIIYELQFYGRYAST